MYTEWYIVKKTVVSWGKCTARLADETLKVHKLLREQAQEIKLPLLLIHGSEDRLADPSGAQLLYDLASSPDKTIKIYDGLYHESFHEPEKEQVFDDVKTWLDAHLDSR